MWLKTDEQIPEHFQLVIATKGSIELSCVCRYDSKRKCFYDPRNFNTFYNVKYWMPIPEIQIAKKESLTSQQSSLEKV